MEPSTKGLFAKSSLIILATSILCLLATAIYAVPIGPSVTIYGNSSKQAAASTKVNSSINGTLTPGGYVFTMTVDSQQQNTRWKGYVGNVTGTMVLDDANDNTLFSWTLSSSISGEVYATRSAGNINWTGINCTWIADGINSSDYAANSNRTPETLENAALSHTNKDDNITATFTLRNHSSITVGSRVIGKNNCFSVHTYRQDTAQQFTDSDTGNFTQVILYDGAFNTSNGNVVYEAKIERDLIGYRSDSTYDFQMMLPESGAVGFSSSTAYFFYVELT